MNREYHKGYSSELHRDMELLVFGHAGTPLLVFPTSQGRFFEYEDRNMIGVLTPKIDAGELQVFCSRVNQLPPVVVAGTAVHWVAEPVRVRLCGVGKTMLPTV